MTTLQAIPEIVTFQPRIAVMDEQPPPEKIRTEGVRCPRCSCGDIPVKFTRHYGQRTKQTRECQHCRKRFGTWLTVIPE